MTLAEWRDRVLAPRKAAFADEPPYDDQVAFYARAWRQLDAERALGFGYAGNIPWSRVKEWCADEGLDRDARELVHGVIEWLDGRRNDTARSKAEMDALNKNKKKRR